MAGIKVDTETKMYVIPCTGGGCTCLGFDVAKDRTEMYAAAMNMCLPQPLEVGTAAAYAFYLDLERAYCQSEYCRTHTTFDPHTPERVKGVLESARMAKYRIRIFLGHPDGRDWHEENDVEGYVSRTMGPIKAPILLDSRSSSGGGCILTACIVKIVETATKRVLYQHSTYQPGVYETRPAVSEGYAEGVWIDGQLHAQFKKAGQAARWIKKMTAV